MKSTRPQLIIALGILSAWLGGLSLAQAEETPHAEPGQAVVTPAEPAGHDTEKAADPHDHEAHGDPSPHADEAAQGEHGEHEAHVPSLLAVAPFAAILLCIAILPLISRTEHWWHKNRSKFTVAGILSAITIAYYLFRGTGFGHGADLAGPGMDAVLKMLDHAVLSEYIPFMVLLFSLYTICGGIQLTGDLKATPLTNTCFLAVGALLASFVGTTGAAMLLIRPLLQTNQEREYVKHTVIFFTFLVANIGGCLLPIGDPPLFLGYLRDVPFLWTLGLAGPWAVTICVVLVIYYIWDTRLYRKEPPLDRLLDEVHIEPLRVRGLLNFVWLLGVVLSVALFVPGKPFLGKFFVVPDYMREGAQLMFVGLGWITSSARIRDANKFNFFAIIEVAALFIGIFICMQVPVEILNAKGGELPLTSPMHFFWATGTLSSFLDNAPTYVVFFETARAMPTAEGVKMIAGVAEPLLIGISLGAVFMGAMTYIGNGPNFMVKSIAEHADVKMPSFFGYMIYSVAILVPTFVAVTVLFFYVLA